MTVIAAVGAGDRFTVTLRVPASSPALVDNDANETTGSWSSSVTVTARVAVTE